MLNSTLCSISIQSGVVSLHSGFAGLCAMRNTLAIKANENYTSIFIGVNRNRSLRNSDSNGSSQVETSSTTWLYPFYGLFLFEAHYEITAVLLAKWQNNKRESISNFRLPNSCYCNFANQNNRLIKHWTGIFVRRSDFSIDRSKFIASWWQLGAKQCRLITIHTFIIIKHSSSTHLHSLCFNFPTSCDMLIHK